MINIRYHIVSITAVFLALGIGVALGSTFLDRATVNLLDKNISSAETRIKDTKAENDRLSHDLAEAQARDASLVQDAGQATTLADVPVVVVVASGVEQKVVDGVRTVLAHNGADLRGTLQLRKGMRFDGDVDESVAAAVGKDPSRRGATKAAVYKALDKALLAAGAESTSGKGGGTGSTTTTSTTAPGTTTQPGVSTTVPAATTTTTTKPSSSTNSPDGEQPAIVTALLDADYLRLTPGPGSSADDPILETTGYRFVFVSGPGLDPADDAALVDLLPATGRALPAVIVSKSQPDPADTTDANAEPVASSAVAKVRTSAVLAGLYNTVDDVETYSGLVAMVETLEGIGTAAPGHYGQGDGATSILPPAS
jgi:hypothetical protein